MRRSIRFCGHTLGTPELDLEAAIRLFRELDLDGIEVIVDDGYQCGISHSASPGQLRRVARMSLDAGLVIAGLAPYTYGLNAADEGVRIAAVDQLRRVIGMAHELSCSGVRILAGRAAETGRARVGKLLDSLAAVAGEAQSARVSLNIENHQGTLADSVGSTLAILEALEDPVFGVIFDPANLILVNDPSAAIGFALQAAYVRHVHAKDFVFVEGTPRAVPIGTGVVDWTDIAAELDAGGYSGFLSLEYERRWDLDNLPPAREVMAQSRDHLQNIFDRLDPRSGPGIGEVQ